MAKKTKSFNVRVTESVWKSVKFHAEGMQMNPSDYIEQLIIQDLNDKKQVG